MLQKKFKKYIIISPEVLFRLRKNHIEESHLTPIERRMAKVLKNNKLTMTQRLAVFHQLIQRFIATQQKKLTGNSLNASKKTSDAVLQTDSHSFADAESQTTKPRLKITKVTQTEAAAEKRDAGIQVYPEAPTFESDFSPTRQKQFGATNSEDDEVDYDEVSRQFEDDIRRASITPLDKPADMERINLKHLDDPNKSFVVLEDPEQSTVSTAIQKPDVLIKHQRKGLKRRKNEADNLSYSYFIEKSPVKSRLRNNSSAGATSKASTSKASTSSSSSTPKKQNFRSFEKLMDNIRFPKTD